MDISEGVHFFPEICGTRGLCRDAIFHQTQRHRLNHQFSNWISNQNQEPYFLRDRYQNDSSWGIQPYVFFSLPKASQALPCCLCPLPVVLSTPFSKCCILWICMSYQICRFVLVRRWIDHALRVFWLLLQTRNINLVNIPYIYRLEPDSSPIFIVPMPMLMIKNRFHNLSNFHLILPDRLSKIHCKLIYYLAYK